MAQSWSEIDAARRAIRSRWPDIWSLRRIARAKRYVLARIRPGDRVLDVGASAGAFGTRLPEGVVYRSLDVDPRQRPDYRSLDEVESGAFEVVVCFETVEHLTLDQARHLAAGVARVLAPGGRLFLTTPNIHRPAAYLDSATHRTPFCYDELGALLAGAGMEVQQLLRCHHDAFLKAVVRLLAYPLYRILGLDFARSVLAVARRPSIPTRAEK